MVTTRQQSGAISTKPKPDQRTLYSDDEDQYEKESDVEPTPKKARARPRNGKGKPKKDDELKKACFDVLPIEIVSEIFSLLHPSDLLRVSRTSKDLHGILMSKTSIPIWKSSRMALEPLPPPCPSDWSEPRWAALLFEPRCDMCHASGVKRADWSLRLRGCGKCFAENLVLGRDALPEFSSADDMKEVLTLLPYTNSVKSQANGQSQKKYFYLPAIREMAQEFEVYQYEMLACIPGAEARLENFKRTKQAEVQCILDMVPLLKDWALKEERRKSEVQKELVEKARSFFREKLGALGHELLDVDKALEFDLPQINAVNHKVWERSLTSLERATVHRKEWRLEELQLSRWKLFGTFYGSYLREPRNHTPFEWFAPSPSDLLTKNLDIRAAVESGVAEEYEAISRRRLPGILVKWRRERIKLLIDKILTTPSTPSADGAQGYQQNGHQFPLVAASLPHTRNEDRAYILSLAKAVFRCKCARGWGGHGSRPLYFEASLSAAPCMREDDGGIKQFPNHVVPKVFGWELRGLEYHSQAARNVDMVCRALGLDPNITTVHELDELDARFRCVACSVDRKMIRNWRMAVAHEHVVDGTVEGGVLTFERISDDDAEFAKFAELIPPYPRYWMCEGRFVCKLCGTRSVDIGNHFSRSHHPVTPNLVNCTTLPHVPPEPVPEERIFGP